MLAISEDRTQKQLFQESGVASLLDASLLGYSSTVLAYGQTGSGKTYTMMGKQAAAEGGAKAEEGSKDDGSHPSFADRTCTLVN